MCSGPYGALPPFPLIPFGRCLPNVRGSFCTPLYVIAALSRPRTLRLGLRLPQPFSFVLSAAPIPSNPLLSPSFPSPLFALLGCLCLCGGASDFGALGFSLLCVVTTALRPSPYFLLYFPPSLRRA